ncbi:MAG: LytTR family transcriptional regulator DNA-binding domain-containing protein [Bacteroidales bacterium]|nr:LytTR family transcriptional regulator DNA-binding domain-containing protein [Bacteroidales bacterium]
MESVAISSKLEGLTDVKPIIYLKSIGNFSMAYYSNGEEKLIENDLDLIQEKLPLQKFFRISESFIVNIDHLKKIRVSSNKNVLLHNGIELELDFKRYPELKWFLRNRYCV